MVLSRKKNLQEIFEDFQWVYKHVIKIINKYIFQIKLKFYAVAILFWNFIQLEYIQFNK